MPLVSYVEKDFRAGALGIIASANKIIAEYQRQGFKLTLRQLYYQFIAKDLFPDDWIDTKYNIANGLDPNTKNTIKSYKSLQTIISDGRLAGKIDWEAIEDRTRETVIPSRWASPASIVQAVSQQYRIDKWANQQYRPEVWVEKEALSGVFEPVCKELDVPLLCCRGYTSQSEMWESAMRMVDHINDDEQIPVILHFGDHDPSGIDMSRDIEERLTMFLRTHCPQFGDNEEVLQFNRVALTMAQIRRYKAPPNPAKATDSRFAEYRKQYGDASWELDALDPRTLAALVRSEVQALQHPERWEEMVEREDRERGQLQYVSNNWAKIIGKRK